MVSGQQGVKAPALNLGRRGDRPAHIRIGAYELAKKGAVRYDLRDPYYLAVALSWPRFLLGLLALYLVANIGFATLYLLQAGDVANARAGSLADAFFFSTETLATVGYGEMYPATLYGHVVASSEIVCGMALTAIMTGLLFVRFSRPKARILYAEKVVVASHNGRPTLMLRIGNGRTGLLSDAAVRLNALIVDRTEGGQFYRHVHELKLSRSHFPVFAMTWTVMHELGPQSPLHGYDAARLADADVQLFLTVEARDPALAATVHDLKTYTTTDILFGMRYVDAISLDANRRPIADLTRISLVEPDIGEEHDSTTWADEEPSQATN